METINIKFDEEQLKDIVEKVTENIIKEAKKDLNISVTNDKSKKKWSLMYLESYKTHAESEKYKFYYGYCYNTLSKDYAYQFYLDYKPDLKKVEELKNKGWKEEVVYK